MTTPASKITGASRTPTGDNNNGDIQKSIAALRSVLMLDTPARNILGGRLATPAHSNDHQENPSPLLHGESSSSSVLKKQLKDEIARRKTLETTYDSLTKLQKQQSEQLETIASSRKNVEKQLSEKELELKVEKEARSQDRMHWKPQIEMIQDENKKLQQTLLETQHQRDELNRKVEIDLAGEMAKLKQQLADKEQEQAQMSKTYEERLRNRNDEHEEVVRGLQAVLRTEKMEQELRLQDTEGRLKAAETDRDQARGEDFFRSSLKRFVPIGLQLASTKVDRDAAQEKLSTIDHIVKERDEMKEQVENLETANEEAEKELEDISVQLGALNEKIATAHKARERSEQELQQMVAELATVKQQLDSRHALEAQNADLEKRLQDLEETCTKSIQEVSAAQELVQALEQDAKEKEQIQVENESLAKRLQDMTQEKVEAEELKEKLAANESIVMNNDEMVSLSSFCIVCTSGRVSADARYHLVTFDVSLPQLRTVELDLEETRNELAKKSTEAASLLEERTSLQEDVKAKERAVEELRSDVEKVRRELQKKAQVLVDNRKELAEVRLQLSENEKEKAKNSKNTESREAKRYELRETKLQEKISSLETQVASVKTVRDEHLEEVATYRETIRELEGEKEDLLNQVRQKIM
ncbi:MAG: hypothetical protein SGILL_002392 [Bacillariaceae sp.]